MPRVVGPVNPAQSIEINIVGATVHVFAYRLWWRDANSDWAVVGDGSTGDQQPDHYLRPFTPGAQLFRWFGVGGKPNSDYEAVVTLSQGGKVLPNGVALISGRINANGIDVQQDWDNFV